MNTKTMTHRVFAMLLCLCMIFTNFNGLVIITGEANTPTRGTDNYIADANTMDTYSDALKIAENTQNAGRVWADKSVSIGDIDLDMETDGYEGTIINDSDFLHVFSTIGSSSEIYQDNIPADIVFILDFSASMNTGTDRLEKMVESVNNAINTIVEKSPNSRIGIVAYSSTATEILPLSKLVPEAGVTKTQWFAGSDFNSSASACTVRFNANVQEATSADEWGSIKNINESVKTNSGNTGIGMQTNLQSGLALGMSMLADEKVTKWYSKKTEKTYSRIPAVIVMTDGECNLLCQSNDGNQKNAWWNANPATQYQADTRDLDETVDGIAPIIASTAMTAAYNVTRIYENYYSVTTGDPEQGQHVYVYGISVDTNRTSTAQQKINAILNSSNYFNDNTVLHESLPGVIHYDKEWRLVSDEKITEAYNALEENAKNGTSYLAGSLYCNHINEDDDGVVSWDHSYPVDIGFDDLEERTGFTPQQIFDNIHYTDSFYDVAKDEQNEIFDKIVKEVINVNMFIPIGGTNDVNLDNALTYVDPIGKYMEIKDIKSLLLFGKLYGLVKDGAPIYYDQYGNTVSDDDAIDNKNYAYFQQNYRIDANGDGKLDADDDDDRFDIVTNPCYSDEDKKLTFRLSQIEIYTKTTWDYRDPDIEDGNIRADTGGDQSLYINIPVLALPVQKATIQLDSNGEIENYLCNTNDKTQSTPLRVFYTVGVADAVKTNGSIDLAKLSPDYVAANKNETTGEVYLYSNWYNREKQMYTHYVTGEKTAYTFGDAVITFSPDVDNSYYRYQKYLPVYNADTDEQITDIDPEGSYYIINGYYTAEEKYEEIKVYRKGAEFGSGIGGAGFGEYLSWYDPATGDVQTYTKDSARPRQGYVLAARAGGVSIGDMAQNISEKNNNQTNTSETYYMPTISDSTSGDVLVVNIYFGNNGRLSVTDTQLLVTKTVDRIGADDDYILQEEFEYTIKLEGIVGPADINAIKVTSTAGGWRSLIDKIELLTNNQGLLLNEGGALYTYEYNNAKYYIFVGGNIEEQNFTHTLFEKSDENSLDDLLGSNDKAALNVEAYLLPVEQYSVIWEFDARQSYLFYIENFKVGEIDTTKPIGYEINISEYQSATTYEYTTLHFDQNGESNDLRLRDGEGILLLGLDPETKYTVTERLTPEQADDKAIMLKSVDHVTSARRDTYTNSQNGIIEGDSHRFDNTEHEYTVSGETGTPERREVHYCNFIPKAEKELVSTDKGYVNVGDTLEYEIYWENFCPDGDGGYSTADVVITDELDPGLDFVSAEYDGAVLNAPDTEETLTAGNGKTVTISHSGRTVKWTIHEVPPETQGYVRLTVKVNENALKNSSGAYDCEISNKAVVDVGEYTIKTNPVDTPVTDVHKWEIGVKPNGENDFTKVSVEPINGDEPNLKQDGVTGNYVGPNVEKGTQIRYKITFVNYTDEEGTVTIKDRLDPDVAFVRAEYDNIYLDAFDNPEDNGEKQGDVTITYYSSKTVEWKIDNVPPHTRGEVYLTVQVLTDEPGVDNGGNDNDAGNEGGGESGSGNTGGDESDELYFPDDEYTFKRYAIYKNDVNAIVLDEGAYIIGGYTDGTTIYALTNVINSSTSFANTGNYNVKSSTLADGTTAIEKTVTNGSNKDIIWIVEYDDGEEYKTARYFYLRNVENGQYLSYSNSDGLSFAAEKSGAAKWDIDTEYASHLHIYNTGIYLGSTMFGTFSTSPYTTYPTKYFRTDAPTPPAPVEPPPPLPVVPEKDTDEPAGIEGDYKIKNTASVKVNSDPKQTTETMENPMAGELVIEKQFYGTVHSADINKEFDFTVTLTPDETGEKFDPSTLAIIKTYGENQTDVTINWEETNGSYKGAFKLKGGEALHIAGVTCKVDYTVQEADESGYTLHHVTKNGSVVEAVDRSVSGTIDTGNNSTEIVVFYNLSEMVELPAAGGTGTRLCYLLGGLLILGAGLWYITLKKKSSCVK